MYLHSVNPATNKKIRSYKVHSPEQVSRKIVRGHAAWLKWKETGFKQRALLMNKAAKLLLEQKQELAHLMALEMGKPLAGGIAEIEKCAAACRYYADGAEGFLAGEPVATEASKSYVSFQPLGLVLAVMPWNFPFWQVFRFLAPALMAGNAGLLKHASNVQGCAAAIERILLEAGFPPKLFQNLVIGSAGVEQVIEHPLVQAVTLTGSTAAGKKVAEKAGSLLKKTVLELGGSDAYIILKDADLELAARVCAESRLINSGQSCIAAKRFIVERAIEKEFTLLFVNRMKAAIMGDPLQEGVQVGPQARTDLRDELHSQVETSLAKGARCLTGGFVPHGNHAFYPPTVLSKVRKGMPAYDEELFGPVAAIISAKDEDDAIRLANDSMFGLGGAIFSRNVKKAEALAATRLQAGSCFVNALVRSDPRLPFGGIKQSGYGRELGLYGIKEFVNIKTVYIL